MRFLLCFHVSIAHILCKLNVSFLTLLKVEAGESAMAVARKVPGSGRIVPQRSTRGPLSLQLDNILVTAFIGPTSRTFMQVTIVDMNENIDNFPTEK